MKRNTRYKEICEAYNRGVKECDEYRQECRDFVLELKASIVEHFGCAEHKIRFFPPTKGLPLGATSRAGDPSDMEFSEDGYCLIGVAINANGSAQEIHDKWFTFIVQFKKIRGIMQFSLFQDENRFPYDPDGLQAFCDFLFAISKETLEKRLEIFLLREEETVPIGFQVDHS